MALDIWYVQNASLWLDLKVMALTVPMVVFGERLRHDAVKTAWRELRLAGVCCYPGDEPEIEGAVRSTRPILAGVH
jgi:hypothetical protein